uniref:Uncharacterized protein n=1 Tax=Populus trichocarpa TaxID=3694 RepID=A0A3N7FX58_POPTR
MASSITAEAPVDTNHEWHLLLFMSLLLPEPSLKLAGRSLTLGVQGPSMIL